MLTKEKKERLDKLVRKKHFENQMAIAQGKRPPNLAIHRLSKTKNLDNLLSTEDKNKLHNERTGRLVCNSLDKVLMREANRLEKEGVENAILKFKKAFHIVEWLDGELTSYKHLSEVASKGSKPWLNRNTLTLVECALRLSQFKNKDEINVQDFVDQIFNPITDIMNNSKPATKPPSEERFRFDSKLSSVSSQKDWICLKRDSEDFKNYPLEDEQEQKKQKKGLNVMKKYLMMVMTKIFKTLKSPWQKNLESVNQTQGSDQELWMCQTMTKEKLKSYSTKRSNPSKQGWN